MEECIISLKELRIRPPHVKFRLFGTRYCQKCRRIRPNDLFSPFRVLNCQCGDEIKEKEGIASYIEALIKRDFLKEAFIGDQYSIKLNLQYGVVVEIPYRKIDPLEKIKYIQKIYCIEKDKNPDLTVIANFDQNNIYIGLLKKNEKITLSSKEIHKVSIIIITEPTFEPHIPAWEASFLQAIYLALKNEFSLAIVLLHTTFEIFLSESVNIALTEQNCINTKFKEKMLNRTRFDTIRQKIFLQVCKDDYNPNHHLWRDFHENVTKPRREIVHKHIIDKSSDDLLKAALATYGLIYYLLECFDEKFIHVFKRKWNRSEYFNQSLVDNIQKE